MAHWLTRLLSPQSIAIVGASERPGSIAATTHRQLSRSGYPGQVFSVNPTYVRLHGERCHATLHDLPQVPDLVVYAISGLALEQSFERALALGVGGILIYASNYIDNETAPKLTERLRQKAAAAGIPVCGGNSMGFYNYDDNVMVSFDHPPVDRPGGHIGMILHSGSAMTYLANNDARFCFNYVIASGQETNATIADYMDYLLEQESTRVIAIFLETVRDVPAFDAALQKARNKSIPVVITRVGRTEKSAQLAMSHSGAIVGNHEAFVAFCERHGAILCRDADEMIVTAMLFAAGFRVAGGALASMLDSGGMREQMVDLAEDYGVRFAQISAQTTRVLRQHLETGLEAVNPMDGMGALGRNTERTYLECGKALLDDADTGLLSFEFEFRDGFSHYPELFAVAKQLAAYSDKPLVLVNSCSYASLQQTAAEFTWQGIPVINGIDLCLRALHNLIDFQPLERLSPDPVEFDREAVNRWVQRIDSMPVLDETSSLSLMADFGFPTTAFVIADELEQALDAAQLVGYPLVMKIAEPGIMHKSDRDGVRVGIETGEHLQSAYADFRSRLGARVVIMPLIEPGVEVSLGMKNDPQYGPMVIVACGGIFIELLAERSFRLAPIDCHEAGMMIDRSRLARLLAGVRGRPPVDRAALVELIVRFSGLVLAFGDAVAEIDLNPVIVNRHGCTIVDALIVPRHKSAC